MTLKMINIPLNQQNIPFIAITLYFIRSAQYKSVYEKSFQVDYSKMVD
ncbi:hypothetical protein [Staphylococcus delphini]|nr:hypothetical protein [Staphylococcus delphini]